jgi:hypothetical protein
LGWRVAFLASGLLIGVGIWMRTRVAESPLYRAYAERRAQTKGDALGRTLLAQWRSVLTVLLVKAAENALFYVFTTFFIVYVTRVLHQPRTLALEAAAVGSIADVVAIFAAGAFSDRVGRLPVTAFGLIGRRRGRSSSSGDGERQHGRDHGRRDGWRGLSRHHRRRMSAFFVELFPTKTRYTGFSIGHQFATVFTGALAPLHRRRAAQPLWVDDSCVVVRGGDGRAGLAALGMAGETKGRDLSA